MRSAVVLFPLLLSALSAAPQSQSQPAPITLDDLRTRPVIGNLGVPLGTAVELEATIIAGRDLHMKAYDGEYLLRVIKVNGKPLPNPPVMQFHAPTYTGVPLPQNEFDLYEYKKGKKTGTLTSDQISALEKGYVASTVRLLAYESGEFSGIPHLPPGSPNWQDHAFTFTTHLLIMAKRH